MALEGGGHRLQASLAHAVLDLEAVRVLRVAGVRLGRGIAAGAAAGVGLDLAFAGLSLGAATAIGALAGGGLQTLRHFGRRALGRVRGRRELSVENCHQSTRLTW